MREISRDGYVFRAICGAARMRLTNRRSRQRGRRHLHKRRGAELGKSAAMIKARAAVGEHAAGCEGPDAACSPYIWRKLLNMPRISEHPIAQALRSTRRRARRDCGSRRHAKLGAAVSERSNFLRQTQQIDLGGVYLSHFAREAYTIEVTTDGQPRRGIVRAQGEPRTPEATSILRTLEHLVCRWSIEDQQSFAADARPVWGIEKISRSWGFARARTSRRRGERG